MNEATEVQRLSVAEIVGETVEYYSANPKGRRGTNDKGGCEYLTEGRMCAVGRCAIDPTTLEGAGTGIMSRNPNTHQLSNLDTGLHPKYRGHLLAFWSALQWLHDNKNNWSDNGITLQGVIEANAILEGNYDGKPNK